MRMRAADRYWYGGTSRLSGAGLSLNTRPDMSNVEPWQGHRKPPGQSAGSDGWAPAVNLSLGEQPRWVQTPITTRYSELPAGFFKARSSVGKSLGVVEKLGRSDLGSARLASFLASSASCSGVRRRIQTGLPRHSTVIFSPAFKPLMSASTAAPAARARSLGWKLL